MATAAPLLAAGQLRRGQIPAEVTGFVGRQAELACLSALLSSARLITVSGPGGVGKTRVAVRVATEVAGKYPDGVCFADLSALRDPSRLAATVAECLCLPDAASGENDLAAVLAHLRDRRLLLVLDTCEHLVDACAAFAEALLREVPGVTMLATSREPFDIPGEHTLPIPPLPVPGPDGGPARPGDAVGHGDAVELFTQRAAAASPSFVLTGETLPHVARLCRRLDGIPLAIELAAVRLRALPLPELADRLEHRFHMLDGGRRGAVPRHQTLRTAIQWSYDLCTPAEQELWTRLSVFAGAFAVSAAEYVCAAVREAAPDPGWDRGYSQIIDPLIGLVDKSVVLRDGARGNRYRLPDTLREFGALRLAASGEEGVCRERHLAYYRAQARRFAAAGADGAAGPERPDRAGAGPRPDGQRERFQDLRASHGNLCEALRHEIEGTEAGDGAGADGAGADGAAAEGAAADGAGTGMAATLLPYWLISGRLVEGRSWLDRAIGERIPDPSAERAKALIARAGLRAVGGEAVGAAEDAREGIRIAARLGEHRLEARGYLSLHSALTFGGWEADAAAAGDEAARRLTALGDACGLTVLGAQQAHLLQLTGSPQDAVRQCERTLRRLRGRGEWWLRGCLHTIAALACVQMPGSEDRCGTEAVRGLRASHEAGDMPGTAYALEAMAWLAASGGRLERTAWLMGATDPLWKQAGARLSGTAIMLQAHERAAKTAADGLGEQRFAALRALGAACPLDTAVAAAADDADDLDVGQPTAPRGRTPAGRRTGGPAADPQEAGLPVPRPRQSELTSREREIAALVARGLSNREIAARLVISKRTVDAHVEHIFGKLRMSSRVQLTLWLRQQHGQSGQAQERSSAREHGASSGAKAT